MGEELAEEGDHVGALAAIAQTKIITQVRERESSVQALGAIPVPCTVRVTLSLSSDREEERDRELHTDRHSSQTPGPLNHVQGFI